MATFNPQPQISEVQVRDQSSTSRGTGTNKAFEALFSGLGQVIGQGAQVADTAVQNNIEKDARYGFDALNDETGLSVNVVPADITQSGAGLQKLADAHLQGKITQEYYYQRLASTLKGLRTKYPGYEKEVDSIVQNVTGVRPANAFRDALWSGIDAVNRERASSAGKMESWAAQKENSEVLGILYPDYWTNPEKYASDEVKGQIRANVSQYQGRVRLADDTTKLMSSDKAVAKPQVGRLFSTVVNGYIVGGSEQAGVGTPNVQNMLSNALSDGTVDQNEKESILGFIAQIRAKSEADLRNRVASSDWGTNFTSAEINEEVKNALDPLNQMEALVTSDNVSAAVRIAERNKAVTDQATKDLYDKFPQLGAATALRGVSEAAADTAVMDIIDASGGGIPFLDKVLGKDLAEGVVSGTISLNQVTTGVSEAQGKTGKEKEQILSQVLDATTSVLASPDASPEIKLKTVKSVYGDNLDETWKVVDDSTDSSGTSQRMRLYNKMFNPAITKQVAALGDSDALETYTAAAADKFQQIPEFRRAASTLNNMIGVSQFARVNYDPERNRLIVEVDRNREGAAGFFARDNQRAVQQDLVKATNAFNQALTIMAPIIEASGVDEMEGVRTLTEQVALNLQGEAKDGFFWWLVNRIDGAVAGKDSGRTRSVNPDNEPAASLRSRGGMVADDSVMGGSLLDAQTQLDQERRDARFSADDTIVPQGENWEEIGGSSDINDDDVSWNLSDGGTVPELGYAATDRSNETPFNAVLRAGRGWTEIEQPDGSRVRRTGSRNWRNNNPGNIEYGKFAKSQGAIGTDGRFAVFPSYEAGRKAKESLLFESPSYRSKTISGAINRYAPPFENDTTGYANAVARAIGVPVSTPVADLTPSQRERMLDAMERVEGFRVGRETRVE